MCNDIRTLLNAIGKQEDTPDAKHRLTHRIPTVPFFKMNKNTSKVNLI